MRQLQNDPEKIRFLGFSTKNHRSNTPPDSAFTYGLIKYMAAHKSQKPASAAASNAIYLSLIFGRPVFPPRRTSTKCLK